MSRSLILASQSPRRQAFLKQMGYDFQCLAANIDESQRLNETPYDYVTRLALAKAQYIANIHQQAVVLGSDTSVIFDGQVLGKPQNQADCLSTLSLLSGQKHQVLTAIAVVSSQKSVVEVVATDVFFKALSKQEMQRYWQTGEPQDKAGSYGIQGIGGQFVKQIHGSYSAVVGLPLYETAQLLSSFGLKQALTQD